MIPNGKQMDWNGHNLTFESEHDQCTGCFFANKNECPDCDEGIWVEEDYPWHTGKPTEDGEYLVICHFVIDNYCYRRKLVWDFENGDWKDIQRFTESNYFKEFKILAWYGQKIKPYEEK